MVDALDLLDQYFETAFAAPDGIKRLRELILSLAMRGKLVPQDPHEQPANVLLKEIEAEKNRLVKEGKIKKSKPLPEITPDEIPYKLPDSWEWVKLSDISIKIHYGYTASANHELKDIRLLRITDIQDNKVDWKSVPGCDIKEKDIDQYILENNDILIARTGGTVGKSYLVENINVKSVFASYLIRVIPSKNLDVNCLKLFIESPFYWKQLYEKCSGTGQPNVNGTALSNLILPLPPLEEQRRIVERIDRLMDQVDVLEKLRAERDKKRLIIQRAAGDRLLKSETEQELGEAWDFLKTHFNELYSVKENVSELRKAILQLAVMGKLVPQDPNDPPASELLKKIEAEKQRLIKAGKIKKQKPLPEISPEEIPYQLPNHWKWSKVFNLSLAVEYGTSQKTCDHSSKIPVYRMGNIVNGKLLDVNFKYIDENIDDLPRLYLQNNDILFNRTNSYELVGKSALYKGKDNVKTFASYLIRIKLAETHVYPEYINMAMNAPYFRETQINPEITQQCGQANFNGTKLSSTLIPLPPLPEQHRIVAKVDQLMALCDQLEAKIEQRTSTQTDLLNALIHNT